MTTSDENMVSQKQEKITEIKKIVKNISDCLAGKDYESIGISLCFSLAAYLYSSIEYDEIEAALDGQKAYILTTIEGFKKGDSK